ncbi:hypothetical protein ACIQWB_36760 [Streptomyces olivaceus]|uniref:hypothetical protein n=1 Tax=Streptomyces olivaceus TaxID=47716 RepID=UPI003830A2B4
MGLTVRVRSHRKMLTLEAGMLSSRTQPLEEVTLTPHTAEFAALLTSDLGTGVRLRRVAESNATAVHLVGPDSDVLRSHGIVPENEDGPSWSPITIALVRDDPDQPIDIYLEPVPGTSVGYEGNLALFLADAAARLIRHYAQALTSSSSRP